MLTNQKFVSRDVRFCEHIFPFKHGNFDAFIKPVQASRTPTIWTCNYLTYLSTISSFGDITIQASTPPLSLPTLSPILVPTTQSDMQSSCASRRSTRPIKPPTWLFDFVSPYAHHIPHKHLYPIT